MFLVIHNYNDLKERQIAEDSALRADSNSSMYILYIHIDIMYLVPFSHWHLVSEVLLM